MPKLPEIQRLSKPLCHFNLPHLLVAFFLACGCALPSASAIVFQVYIGAPNDLSSNLSNITEETFEGLNPTNATWSDGTGYSSPLGTYTTTTGNSNILADTIYGAGSDYLSLEPNAVVNLELTQSVAYFGFAWPAGDELNEVTVYQGNTAIFTLSTADIVNFLKTPTVTAVDGTSYNSVDYYGDPLTGSNNGEPYGYIHIVGADIGSTFDRVTFSHLRQSGEFETDNHAVLFNETPTLQGDWVYAYEATEQGGVQPVPEPNSYALITGIAVLALITQRRRSRYNHS